MFLEDFFLAGLVIQGKIKPNTGFQNGFCPGWYIYKYHYIHHHQWSLCVYVKGQLLSVITFFFFFFF